MRKSIKIILAMIIMVIAVLTSLYYTATPTDETEEKTAYTDETTSGKPLEPTHVPEGWKVYKNKDILGGMIAFAHPSDWSVEETTSSIRVYGDGYNLRIKGHSGLPSDMKLLQEPYVVGNSTTRSYQREINGKYEQVIVIENSEFVFWIDTPGMTTELSDQILSTVSFAQ